MYYTEHTVKSFDGTPLYVRESGDKDRPLLLLIHDGPIGFGFGPRFFGSLMPQMRPCSALTMDASSVSCSVQMASGLSARMMRQSEGSCTTNAAMWRALCPPDTAASRSMP